MDNPYQNFNKILFLNKKMNHCDYVLDNEEEKEYNERLDAFKMFLAEYDIKLNNLKHIAMQRPLIANDSVFEYFEIRRFVEALNNALYWLPDEDGEDKERLKILKEIFEEVIRDNDEQNVNNPIVQGMHIFKKSVNQDIDKDTLYNGINDILNRKIPRYLITHHKTSSIKELIGLGFRE
jgi:hypothetical protein